MLIGKRLELLKATGSGRWRWADPVTRCTYRGWTIEAVGLLLPDGRWRSELYMTHPVRSPVSFGLGEECDTQTGAEQAAVLRAQGQIDVFGPAPPSADAGGAATPSFT